MQIYPTLNESFLPYSYLDLIKVQERKKLQEKARSIFEWNDKYLPFVIAGLGLIIIPLITHKNKKGYKK